MQCCPLSRVNYAHSRESDALAMKNLLDCQYDKNGNYNLVGYDDIPKLEELLQLS